MTEYSLPVWMITVEHDGSGLGKMQHLDIWILHSKRLSSQVALSSTGIGIDTFDLDGIS